MPPGGTPADDDAYMTWARDYVAQVNWCLKLGEKPEVDGPVGLDGPINEWRVSWHLFKWLHGGKVTEDDPQNIYRKRVRYLAVQFKFRREEMIAEADRYVESIAEDVKKSGRFPF